MLADLARAREKLAALEAALNVHVTENGVGVRFQSLSTFLARVEQSLQAGKSGATAAVPAPAEAAAAAAAAPSTGGTAMPTAPAPAPAINGAAIPGRINSRGEVEQCLDLIIDFYERTEPSSPIPHLARRMRKMVPMNFMQLMEEIAPSGMKEFRNVAGVFDEKAK
jgi:type VI secretion system protein ImpA